jgi:hypothetical protein
MASSNGNVCRYSMNIGESGKVSVFPEDNKNVTILKADSAIIAMCMDELNNEGVIGT